MLFSSLHVKINHLFARKLTCYFIDVNIIKKIWSLLVYVLHKTLRLSKSCKNAKKCMKKYDARVKLLFKPITWFFLYVRVAFVVLVILLIACGRCSKGKGNYFPSRAQFVESRIRIRKKKGFLFLTKIKKARFISPRDLYLVCCWVYND